jgi:hypothetical protein
LCAASSTLRTVRWWLPRCRKASCVIATHKKQSLPEGGSAASGDNSFYQAL